MFIKRWLGKNRFKRFKEKYFDTTLGTWDMHYTSVHELVTLVLTSDLTQYCARSGSTVRIRVAHNNIYVLLGLLDEALDVLNSDRDVSKAIQKPRNAETLFTIRLDDYLVTNDNIPLKPKEFIHALYTLIHNLTKALNTVKNKNPRKYDYYVRHFTHLIEETFEVLLGLVEVDQHARKQRSRKDVIL